MVMIPDDMEPCQKFMCHHVVLTLGKTVKVLDANHYENSNVHNNKYNSSKQLINMH